MISSHRRPAKTLFWNKKQKKRPSKTGRLNNDPGLCSRFLATTGLERSFGFSEIFVLENFKDRIKKEKENGQTMMRKWVGIFEFLCEVSNFKMSTFPKNMIRLRRKKSYIKREMLYM